MTRQLQCAHQHIPIYTHHDHHTNSPSQTCLGFPLTSSSDAACSVPYPPSIYDSVHGKTHYYHRLDFVLCLLRISLSMFAISMHVLTCFSQTTNAGSDPISKWHCMYRQLAALMMLLVSLLSAGYIMHVYLPELVCNRTLYY